MPKKIVAGNWKMNNTHAEGLKLVSELMNMLADEVNNDTTVVVCPPFIHLSSINQLIANDSRIKLGAQNCAAKSSGAFTGEVSVEMLNSVGVQYVIVGHSERRCMFGDTSDQIINKINLTLGAELLPIYCCGELLAEREAGKHFDTVKQQLKDDLFHLDVAQIKRCVIAYEPVWAIGTGKTATSAQAQEMHAFIRSLLAEQYGQSVAKEMSILYGGSCNAQNAAELFANPDVDGGLIGGASLKSRDFTEIVKACK